MEDSRLLEALKKYPILEVLFGKEWFLRGLSEKEENRHVLINHLLEEKPEVENVKKLFADLNVSLKAGRIKDYISIDAEISELLYLSEFLRNLEIYLKKLKEVKGLNRIINELRETYDATEFLHTVDKIEIASNFVENFDGIEIETEVERHKADFKVKHKDRIILFDVITPDKINEFIKDKVPLLRERPEERLPLVSIVDISYSKIPRSKTSQLYDIEEISGVVIYCRVVLYGTPIPTGFFIENPKAKNKLLRDEISVLCRSLRLIRFPATEFVQVFSKKSFQKRLKKGGFYTTQSLLQKSFAEYLGDWMKSPEDASLFFLVFVTLLKRQSDKYEYRCYTLSSLLHFSALTTNAENWWRELMRLREPLSFLQSGIAQIQNLETILLSKRRASEEIKISLLLPLYTSTLEGIFQHMARTLVMEMNIIAGKSSKDVPMMGIPRLVQKINSFNEGELRVLTKGYNQTLRNAYSHGSYDIHLRKREIVARDRKKKETFTFTKLKLMKNRLEQASYMVALSLVAVFLRLALEQEKREKQ